EKHALLTRVRLPGLIRMATQLADEIGDEQLKVFAEQPDPDRYRAKVIEYRDDLHSLLSEFFLASGHPHSAFDSLCQRSDPKFLEEVAKKVPAKRCEQMSESLAKERESRRQRKGASEDESAQEEERKKERRALRIYRDLASACQDPILSGIQFPTLGQDRSERPDWPAQYVETAGPHERANRLSIARTVYMMFIDAEVKRDRSKSLLERDWSESDDDGDLVMGTIRRMLEFRLTQYPIAWVGSAEVYWDRSAGEGGSEAARYREKLDSFRTKVSDHKEPLNPDHARELYNDAPLLRGSEPILRSSDRRRRNECHRLCLIARLKVAEKFGGGLSGDKLLQLAEAWWPRIRRSLEAAEAILSRIGDPADRQAMAITRLTFAELLLRRAETHQLAFDNAQLIAKALTAAAQTLAAAAQTLAAAAQAAEKTEAATKPRAEVPRTKKAKVAVDNEAEPIQIELNKPKEAVKAAAQGARAASAAATNTTALAEAVITAVGAAQKAAEALVESMATSADQLTSDKEMMAEAVKAVEEAARAAVKAAAEATSHRDIAKADHAEAVTLLSTVEALLNEGRGENRWRFFYLLTRSRAHMFKALTLRDDSRRQAQLELHWAARHLVGATSNCGLWTDRYDVLGWWWDTWQSLAKRFFPNQPQQFNQYMREMKARLGIRWFHENYARRDDRWEVFS
ncbi:MAG TPA: hypothetical protein VGE74_29860, partial [Gemmata sp.]